MARKYGAGGKPLTWELASGRVHKRKLFGAFNKLAGGLLQRNLLSESDEPNPTKDGIYRELGDMVLTFVQQPAKVDKQPAVVVNVQPTTHDAYHSNAYYKQGSEPHIPSVQEAQVVLARLGDWKPDLEYPYPRIFEGGIAVLKGIITQTAGASKNVENSKPE